MGVSPQLGSRSRAGRANLELKEKSSCRAAEQGEESKSASLTAGN